MRLVTKAELALHKFCDDTGRMALGNLAISADRTQATNGQIAVTVLTERTDPKDFPSPQDGPLDRLADGAPTLIPADHAKAALKAIGKPGRNAPPVLSMAAVGVRPDGSTEIAATDLDSWHRAKGPEPAEHAPKFPNLDRVRPNGKVIADVGFMVDTFQDALQALKDAGVRGFRLQLHKNLDGPAEMIGRSMIDGLSRVEVVIMPGRVDAPPARPGEVEAPKAEPELCQAAGCVDPDHRATAAA